MRKFVLLTSFIILVTLLGCNDFSSGDSGYIDQPVEVKSISDGEIYRPGSQLEIEYDVNETEQVLDRLVITVTGPDGGEVDEITIDEQPLSGWHPPYNFSEDAAEGLYTVKFDFYSGEELFDSKVSRIFVASSVNNIISINSYPPVLYPGGGGLFHAETDDVSGRSWLRWTLDGEVIASGLVSDGYESIEITAPETEGVYDLSLEVFPFMPTDDSGYSFESTVKKQVPVYVNTEQKSGANEFGPDDDFYALYHFRGNLIDSGTGSAESADLDYTGRPLLSLRNGVFGYYLDSQSGFTSDRMLIPSLDGKLEPFSLMAAIVPAVISVPADQPAELFYTGTEDGNLVLNLDVQAEGRLSAVLQIKDTVYTVVSDNPVLLENEYSSLALAVLPSEEMLSMILFKNGVPVAESDYPVDLNDTVSWNNLENAASGESRIMGGTDTGFEAMIDEVGVYNRQSAEGQSVDPDQFKRAMEIEYGKFLMYAEGFDGDSDGIQSLNPDLEIDGSRLVIPPGGYAEFPPIYPGYEEVEFRIQLAEHGTGNAVFYADVDNTQIGSIDFESDAGEAVSFSLIFSADSIAIEGAGDQDGVTGFNDDFGGVIYRIMNTDTENTLSIESILVIRKNINISEKLSDFSVRS